MKKHEKVVFNEVEYTVELNRKSFLAIDKVAKLQETTEDISKDLYTYKDTIEKGDNPFDDLEDIDVILENAEKKQKQMKELMTKAFWVWLYPEHKLNIDEVEIIVENQFKDENKDKIEYISEKYGEFLQKSVEFQSEYLERQKKLKTLAK